MQTSDKNKIDQVSDLAVFFRPAVVFDELSCSTKGFSTRSRASQTDRRPTLWLPYCGCSSDKRYIQTWREFDKSNSIMKFITKFPLGEGVY